MDQPKRKGRPLLIAAAGVAFVSFVRCEPKDHPVGNLRPPGNIDSGQIEPVGNLRPVDMDTGTMPADAGVAKDAAPMPKVGPVGNLRPPPH